MKKGGTGIKICFRLSLEYFETVIQTADFYHVPVVVHLEFLVADDGL